jgi:hypothetical protein
MGRRILLKSKTGLRPIAFKQKKKNKKKKKKKQTFDYGTVLVQMKGTEILRVQFLNLCACYIEAMLPCFFDLFFCFVMNF